jgi:hypothetical protein
MHTTATPQKRSALAWLFIDTGVMVRRSLLHIKQDMEQLLGLTIQPIMFVVLFLGLALAVRFVSGRLTWPVFSLNKIDISLSIFLFGVILSGIVHGEGALKQSLIVASFVYLYFLSRIFLVTKETVMQALPFFRCASHRNASLGASPEYFVFARIFILGSNARAAQWHTPRT